MRILHIDALKRIMLTNPKSPYAIAMEETKKQWKVHFGREFDPAKDKLPDPIPTTYNSYWKNDETGEEGIVGINCHILEGHGNAQIFLVDLAIETDVPNFYMPAYNVPVVLLEPVRDSAYDGRMHLAEADHRFDIERISTPRLKDRLQVIQGGKKDDNQG
jgi:hypothetical protein